MTRGSRQVAGLGALLATVTTALWLAGHGSLAAPPLWHPAALGRWWAERGPIVATFAAARALLACVGGYLTLLYAGTAVIGPVRRVTRLPGGRWVAAALIGTAAGAGWVPAVALASGTQAPAPTPGPPEMTYLGPATVGPTRPSVPAMARAAQPSVPAMARPAQAKPATTRPARASPRRAAPRRVGARMSARARAPAMVRTASAVPAEPSPAAPEAPRQAVASQWVVRPGDDLWTIAASVLSAHLDRPATVREVAGYWQRLIALNRPGLPVPDDPDLIFPGDIIALPPP